jgi:hypothetical protein
MPDSTDIYQRNGLVREDMYCHACSKNFLATINYDLNGNHQIECPHCHHIHFRVVKDGRVTGDRYDSDARTSQVGDGRSMWKSTTEPIATHPTANSLLRDLWLRDDG